MLRLVDLKEEVNPSNKTKDLFETASNGFPERSRDDHVIDPSYIPKTLKKGRTLSRESSSIALNDSRVLVLYTGGTIGMMRNSEGALAPQPNQFMEAVKRYPQLHDKLFEELFGSQEEGNYCVLPKIPDQKRILYTVFEYEPLLDSSTMTIDDWIKIALDIKGAYENFDGFVILHGTDTLAYTASALSFMLENLGKTIVITGSQIPIFETKSDGLQNFIGALMMAGNYVVPEVTVFFNNRLFRGNRTIKFSTDSLDAFDSPNQRPLAVVGTGISIDYRSIFHPYALQKFCVHPSMSRDVVLIRLFPSITTQAIENFLKEPTRGAVIESYGAGNIPSNRQDLVDLLRDAIMRGVLIVNITQCIKGSVSGIYETGKVLYDIGVINGQDMTSEAALSKLSYVISKEEWSLEEKREMMGKNIRGELSSSLNMKVEDIELIRAVGRVLQLSSSDEVERLRENLYPSVINSAVATGELKSLKAIHAANELNLSFTDYCGRTPLHVACLRGSHDVVVFLLEKGACVHSEDNQQLTPLDYAIEHCHHDIIKVLTVVGAHIKLSPKALGDKLCNAVNTGGIPLLESYRLAGVQLDLGNHMSKTALHMAVEKGDSECVKYLLKHKVNPHCEDLLGNTPLKISKILRRQDIYDLLGENQSDH